MSYRRIVAAVCAATLVIAGLQPVGAASAVAGVGTVSLLVHDIARDDQGMFSWNATLSAGGLGSEFGHCAGTGSCSLVLEGRQPDGTFVIIDYRYLGSAEQDSYSEIFSGSNYFPLITDVRARSKNGDGAILASAWVPSGDHFPASTVTLQVQQFDRSSTGLLSWNATINAAGLGPGQGHCAVPTADCSLVFEGRHADGTVEVIDYAYLDSTQRFAHQAIFTGSRAMSAFSEVRARSKNGDGAILASAWVPSGDHFPASTVSLQVHELARQANGQLSWNVTASAVGLGPGQGHCSAPGTDCSLVLEGKHPDGSIETIDYRWLNSDQRFDNETELSGVAGFSAFSAVRTRSKNGQGEIIASAWTQVSDNVRSGHDVDETYELAMGAAGTLSAIEACYVVFAVGTHSKYNSTVTDQNLDCNAATSKGTSFAGFLKSFLGSASSKTIAAVLVGLGVAEASRTLEKSPDLDYGKTLPAGCSWVGVVQIQCVFAGTTSNYRPLSAPPKQDNLWTQNQASKSETRRQQSGQPSGEIPIPPGMPGDDPHPLGQLTNRDMDIVLAEQCAEYAAMWGESAGLADDACETMPIFGTGLPSPEAAQHDLDALTANPAWFSLSYVTNAEKLAQGKVRSTWSSAPECANRQSTQNCDEYPFFATAEGHPDGVPNLRLIDATQNKSQGGKLTAFANYSCPQLSNPSTFGTSAREFLVVPLPFLPTWTKC